MPHIHLLMSNPNNVFSVQQKDVNWPHWSGLLEGCVQGRSLDSLDLEGGQIETPSGMLVFRESGDMENKHLEGLLTQPILDQV